jgi:tRNA(fMet)-specific endonuclease VapC
VDGHYLLDTHTFIYIRREQPASVMEHFRKVQPGEAAVSVITYGELLYAVAKSSKRASAIATLEQLTQAVPVLPLPETAASIYGTIRAELEASGKIIGNNDLWIAAHAMAAGLILVTNNEKEFRRVRGLRVQNWAK